MTDSEREQLVGHLIGALDEDEQAAIDARLAAEPELREELSAMSRRLAVLASLRVDILPPPGLAERTCRYVDSRRAAPASLGTMKNLSAEAAPHAWTRRLTKLDMVMAATVLFAAAMLIFPAVQHSRSRAHLLACEDNLQHLGKALTSYSESHGGYFPRLPTEGKLAAAGVYAPVLFQNKLLTDVSRVLCPDSRLAEQRNAFRVPTYSELELTPSAKMADLRPTIGGSYGYNLGYTQNNEYFPTKNLYRDDFAIMSDAPSDRPDHQSENHGLRGQNVLFESGRVKFLTGSKLEGSPDDIFANDKGQVAAGLNQNDSVIGASHAAPIIYVSR
jgi:hypothetical protein